MYFSVHRFYRSKATAAGFLYFAGFALLGMLLVFLTQGNYFVMVCAAFALFLGPLTMMLLTKKYFLIPVDLQVTDDDLRIGGNAQKELRIRWPELKAYQVEFTKSLFGSGYALRLTNANGTQTGLVIYEPAFDGAKISPDSALYQLSRSIAKFNRSAENPVELQPNLLSKPISTVIAAVVAMLVLGGIALFFFKGSHMSSKNLSWLSIIVVVLIVGLAGRKKSGDLAYGQLRELHGE